MFGLLRGVTRTVAVRPIGLKMGCCIKANQLITPVRFSFAKISKKKQDKMEKTKEKQQARSKLSNDKEIDLQTMEADFKSITSLAKAQFSKMKLGRLDLGIFDTIYVKAYGADSSKISDLGQIVEKNQNTVIISPYTEDSVSAILKGLEGSGQNFTISRKDQQIIVTQANSSSKQAKQLLLTKVKKFSDECKEKIRKHRSKCMDEIKAYKKIAQQDAVRSAENELQKMYEVASKELQTQLKAKEKELI